MDTPRTYLVDLPPRVPGVLAVDEDGEPSIYLNARLSSVQHKRTYDHEISHLEHDDAYNTDSIEVIEARANGQETTAPAVRMKAKPARKRAQKKQAGLPLSATLREDAEREYGLVVSDAVWNKILMAMLYTSARNERHTDVSKQTYYFPPVRIKGGMMYKTTRKTVDDDSLQWYYLR